MGRDIGTNVYSNNFEPQVMGLLDARGKAATKADLTTTAQWTSTDGNIYAPKAILVAVTDDPIESNNGLYMLKGDDYSVASNWMKIGSDGNMEFVMVDLSFINTIPGTYTPDRYLMGEFIKIQDALSIDTPFFVYQFNAEFGQFPASATIEGDIFELSILYRDEVWFVNFDGSQYTTSKGGTSPLTNVKVLTTSGLLNTSRKGNLYLSSSDVTIWKNIELGRDIIVYSGSIAQEKQYVPLSISSQGEGSLQVGTVTYILNGSMYSFKITYDNNVRQYVANEVKKIEGEGDKTIYLTTEGILDIGGDTELNQQDIDAITKLYTENNSSITNIVYVGTESGGNQFLVPLSCYSDFGGNSPMDVLFLHPWQQKVYHMVIDVFATPPIAYDPEEVIFDSGGSSTSNVKVLTTPDLLNSLRASTINLSSTDIAIIKGLSIGKEMVVYNGINENIEQVVPLSMNSVKSGTLQIIVISYLFANSMYTITINGNSSSNSYSAGKPIKVEGSGGGDSSKFYITTLNLGDISTRDNKAPSYAERVEVDNIISKVQEGYTILSVQNDIEVNDSNSRYGIIAVTLSEDKQQIWMQVADQWNVLTISYNKKVLGAPFYCYYLQKKTEIVELPSDASANLPYENGDYYGNNPEFASKIREISINPTNNYVLKYSPTGYYTVINPYRASSYAGFYISTSSGESLHIYTSITLSDWSYTIQSEGSYSLKQDTLVSGKNIKTINGQSILGSGNIDISGGSGACELHDLSMDVKTGYDAAGNPKIYFRIREKVPNGRIHFVRKKRMTYSPMGTVTYHKRVTYAPMFLDVRTAKDTGMDVSNLMEDTWYEFPIKADDLIGSYPAGSDIEGSMNKRVYATIRFKGNVHAKPLVYDTPSLTKNLTVLQAGLQYNVLSGQRNPLFTQRGDIVKIDVRLRAKSPTNYNLGYEYNYAVK